MMTAMMTVETIVAGAQIYDVWNINEDAEYHEADGQQASTGLRHVPVRPTVEHAA